MARIIGVSSAKGGVGKTVTSLNIGLALHQFGENVTVVDADVTASNLGLQLGFYTFPNTLQHVLNDGLHIHRAIYQHSSGLRVVPSAISTQLLRTNLANLREHLQNLDGIVLVDCPPGLDETALQVMKACDELLVVVNPEIPTVTNAVKLTKVAEEMRKNILGVVINRHKNAQYQLTPSEIEFMCRAHILGHVPEDEHVQKAIFDKTPVVHHTPYAHSAIAYKEIAAKIIGKTYKPPTMLAIRRMLQM